MSSNINNKEETYIFKVECYNIIGACMIVHKELGNAFLEPVYQEALEIELLKQKLPFEREKHLEIYYNGVLLTKKYIADFLCYEQIVVELKATSSLADDHIAQALNYLSALKLRMALLVNFGTSKLQWKRVIL